MRILQFFQVFSIPLLALSMAPSVQAQEYSEREAHIIDAWRKYAAELQSEETGVETQIEPYEFAITPEAQDRKQNSIDWLNANGIPVLETLPVIETKEQSTRRTEDEVAKRALALAMVIIKADIQDQTAVEEVLTEFKARPYLSPDEKAYIDNPTPDESDHVQYIWRYEALNVLVWALSFSDTLGPPDDICDVAAISELFAGKGHDGIIADARLRSQAELLDQTDLAYRQYWAVIDSDSTGTPMPEGLDGDVVWERLYALNWLVGYLDQEWDEVTTDT